MPSATLSPNCIQISGQSGRLGGIASPGLPHHRAYGSVPRRFLMLIFFAFSSVHPAGCITLTQQLWISGQHSQRVVLRVDHLLEQLLILRVGMTFHTWTGLDTAGVPSRIPSGTLLPGAACSAFCLASCSHHGSSLPQH